MPGRLGLSLKVMDKDTLTKDDQIGHAAVPLSSLDRTGVNNLWLDLEQAGKPRTTTASPTRAARTTSP